MTIVVLHLFLLRGKNNDSSISNVKPKHSA